MASIYCRSARRPCARSAATRSWYFRIPTPRSNPRMTIGEILAEPWRCMRFVPPARRRERVAELLEMVGLEPRFARRYPHEFSGGQRQRIAIARALGGRTEARRVRRAGVVPRRFDPCAGAQSPARSAAATGLAYLFISHDLAVVKQIADRVAVVNFGRIVETADTEALVRRAAPPLYARVALGDPRCRIHARNASA